MRPGTSVVPEVFSVTPEGGNNSKPGFAVFIEPIMDRRRRPEMKSGCANDKWRESLDTGCGVLQYSTNSIGTNKRIKYGKKRNEKRNEN